MLLFRRRCLFVASGAAETIPVSLRGRFSGDSSQIHRCRFIVSTHLRILWLWDWSRTASRPSKHHHWVSCKWWCYLIKHKPWSLNRGPGRDNKVRSSWIRRLERAPSLSSPLGVEHFHEHSLFVLGIVCVLPHALTSQRPVHSQNKGTT